MMEFTAETFDRELACTEAQWQACLPAAMGENPFQQIARALTARIGTGQLVVSWRTVAQGPISQARTSRLLVSFRFSGLDEMQRYAFMKRFDLSVPRASG